MPEEDVDQFITDVTSSSFRKYVSMVAYDDNKRQFYALTFENNNIDREDDLVNELMIYLSDNFVLSSDWAYSQMEGNGSPQYPQIEVGQL